jgi:hypothetical protein
MLASRPRAEAGPIRRLSLRRTAQGYACRLGFFDDLEPPPPPEESAEETPAWISAPDGWIGAVSDEGAP